MIVADEDVDRLQPDPAPEMSAFIWFVDITDESHPVPVSSFQVDGLHGARHPDMTGCHQPSEVLAGTVIPFAWFAQGLRLVDISDPFAPREVGCYEPDPPPGCERVSSNDVTFDRRGIAYLTDRQRGVDIVECLIS